MANWQETYKKLKKRKELVDTFSGGGDLAPIKTTKSSISNKNLYTGGAETTLQKNTIPTANRIANTKTKTSKKKKNDDKKWYEGWINTDAFDDGYNFGDITKTILGTSKDLSENLYTGASGIVEKTIDAGAYGIGAIGGAFGNDDLQDSMEKFIKKDLINEEKVGKYAAWTNPTALINQVVVGNKSDKYSLMGEKTDSLVQSGGQLGATMGLQAIGVPWWLTTGATSFGAETENALNNGATYGEAGVSASVSALAETLTEKLSGGISFGGKTADDVLLKPLTNKIQNKIVQTMTKFGIDVLGEAGEEVLTEAISSVGRMSYEDKTLKEALFSEEMVDAYIESAIGGAVLGGGFNVGNVANSIKTGRDYDTGLTQNEQSVLDSVTNQRTTELQKQRALETEIERQIKNFESTFGTMTEAEKTGIRNRVQEQLDSGELDYSTSKLTKKEIAKIEQEVRNDLEKGNLDIDTIENTLLSEKTAQIQELEQELSNTKNSTKKVEIQAKINELQGAKASELKTMLEKDTYLQNSYREANLKTEKFTYEAKETDSEYRKNLANDFSKIANNTTKTHELFETISKIAEDKQTSYGVINNEQLKQLGYDVEGKIVNGLVRVSEDGSQKVLINIDSDKAINRIVGHETTHLLEGTKEYTELQEMIKQYATTKGEYDTRYKAVQKLYDGTNADIDAEVTADLVGDYLFTDTQFVNELSAQNPNIFQKIYNEIKHLYKLATAGSKEARQLERVKKAFDDAYKKNVSNNNETDTKYSIKDNTELYNKVDNEKQIAHATNSLLKLLNSETINSKTFAAQLQNKGLRPALYGNEVIKFKPEFLDYINTEKMYKGDGASNREGISKENTKRFNSLEDFINDDTSTSFGKYNELMINEDMPISEFINMIEGVSIPRGSSQELVNKLNELGIKTEYYNAGTSYNTKAKYSLTDNQGRTLTKEQQEYFKDSKVRDENGNLLEVYHGTKNGNFTIFDVNRTGESWKGYSKYGEGIYFTDDQYEAKDWAISSKGKKATRVVKAYLDIKNPLYDTKENVKIFEDIAEQNNVDISNISNIADVIYALRKAGINTTEYLKTLGYDGIIQGYGEYVVFESNQIKNIDNTNPTSDADIRYSLSEKGTLQDSNGKDVKLETSETGTHGTLMAIHNLNDVKLKGILELGGFPVPSIAITNPSTVDFTNYGDISVLFDKNTIDPTNKQNEVYGSDVYSPRFPQTVQKVNEREVSKLEKYLGKTLYIEDTTLAETIDKMKFQKEFINKFLEENNIKVDEVYKDADDNYGFSKDAAMKQFVIDNDINYEKLLVDKELRNKFYDLYKDFSPMKGIAERKIETWEKIFEQGTLENDTARRLNADFNSIKNGAEKVLDEYSTNLAKRNTVLDQYTEQYESYLTEKLSPIFGNKYIRNNKDTFTPSGNRRSFSQLYDDYSLENIVKRMKGKVRGEEGFFYGAGNIRSQVTPQFKSIADIKANEHKLVTNAEMEEIKQDIDSDLNNLSTTAKNFGGYSYDSYETALNEIAGLKKITPAKAREILNDYGFENVPDILVDKSIEFLEKLKNAPTEYFEAKPQRAVGFDEVQAIVIPNDTDTKLKQQLIDNGLNVIEYDPNIEGDRQSKINQFDDLKFSLSQQGEQVAPTRNDVFGRDIKYQEPVQQVIAPLQEEIQTLTETVNELKEQLAPVQKTTEQVVEYTQPTKTELDNLMALQEKGGTEYANTFFELRDKYGQPKLYKGINEYKKAPDTYEAPIKGDEFAPIPQNIVEQQGIEAFNNIDESNMPGETEDTTPDNEVTPTKSLFETRDYAEVGSKNINAYQYDNPEVKPYFQAEAQSMLGDLNSSIKGQRQYNDDLYYSSGGEQGFFGTERQTTDDIAELLDGLDGKYKYTYADIEKGLNAIIKDEGAENNAISKRIEFYLDQRLREGYTTVDGIEVPANQDYINMLQTNNITTYSEEAYQDWVKTLDTIEAPVSNVDIPVNKVSNSKPVESLAPIKEEYLAITPEKEPKLIRVKDEPTYNQIAEVLTNEPKTESQRNKRKWAIFKANVFDKGIVFEDLSLKENNRELIAKWDYTLTSEARGQFAIGNGHNGLSKSLNDIRAEVENTGNTKDFYNYMYHKHNVDRMTLASRFEGMENKPVFGDSVTAEQSQAIVNQYEKTHPEFIEFAQDVYDYVNADKQVLIDNGVISQETADLWSQMYPHYIPTRRTTDTGIDINVPLDTRKTGINAPIKQATGGSADILPLFDTMAMRTLQTYRATAKNSFGVELKNTLGIDTTTSQTNVDEVIDSIDAQDGLLQEAKKGKAPTFTVFENGEKITFEITPDMYDALKPVSDSSLLSKTIKPLNVAGNIRRGLLTEYNPTFMLTNAIKDTQDILLNSQHAAKTYSKIPEAHKQLMTKGYWYQEYISNGGEQNSYFDNETNTFKTENKGLAKIMDLPPLSTISKINNHIEMIPRLAEYIASREAGKSIEVSMLDAARVTTNFKAGGTVTKFANRNGATFLNASVQGAMQQVRNIREAKANGVRGWVNLATKFAIAGLPAILLNNFIWDDDEEYEELSDYVKQNYYVVGKTDDGTFIRIPKGRTVAVIQEGINQMSNLVTGDDEADLKSFIDLTINNLAPNNPLDNNIFSPITQVATNTAWYGGDLLPTRLQNLPSAEQYDESTDMFSRWIGETFDVSPYKVNYLLDQYSGGLGDLVLPMLTPEAESDGDSLLDYAIAPLKSKFTTNSTFNNQNISDLYDTSEELTINANKTNASDEDMLKNKYINSVKAEMNELYKQKRNIQNSDLSNSEKYRQAKEIQEQINEIAKNGLSEYTNVSEYSNYGAVGDREYYKKINSEGEAEWTKVDDDEADDLNDLGMSNEEKNTYFKTKGEISAISKEVDDTDEKKIQIIDSVLSSGMTDEQKAYLYGKHYSSDKTLDKVTDSGISFDDFLTFSKDTLSFEDTESKVEHLYNSDMTDEAKEVIYETTVLSGFDNEDKYKDYKVAKASGVDINSWLDYKKQEFVADKDSSGKSISGSRKAKIVSYINSLDLSIPQKAILIRQEYPSFDDYNYQIINYVSELDISDDERKRIFEGLDMKILDNGTVTWE